jgi:ketosteroid isomerase-like protein
MSEENVELLYRAQAAFNRRDLDEGVQYLHPEVELRPGVVGPDITVGPYCGREGVRQFWETINDAWVAQTLEPTEIIEAPGDRVLVVERWHVRGRDGLELDFEVIDVYAFRDGLIVRIDGFTDRGEALEAAGLSE